MSRARAEASRWFALAERYLPLPLSVLAIVFTGLSYCDTSLEKADRRAEERTLVWQSEELSQGDLGLVQPNGLATVQLVTIQFPNSMRADEIALAPNERVVRAAWLYEGLESAYEGCAVRGHATVAKGVMPVAVVTSYSIHGKFYEATYLYSLHYILSVSEVGLVRPKLEALAIAGAPKGTRPAKVVANWRPAGCKKT